VILGTSVYSACVYERAVHLGPAGHSVEHFSFCSHEKFFLMPIYLLPSYFLKAISSNKLCKSPEKDIVFPGPGKAIGR